MATVGIETAYLALLDQNQKLLTAQSGLSQNGILEIDKTYLGVAKADIKDLNGKFTSICGNNEIMDQYEEPSNPSISLTINNLTKDIIDKLVGNVALSGGLGMTPGVLKPYVGLVLAAPTYAAAGNKSGVIYYAFGAGHVGFDNLNMESNTETKKNIAFDTLTYSALSYSGFNGNKYATFDSNDSNFSLDKMFQTIWPDYAGTMTAPPVNTGLASQASSAASAAH